MSEQHVRTYAKEADFQLDHLLMQRDGYQMVFISSNVKIKDNHRTSLGARLASLVETIKPGALMRLLAGSSNHHCRIIAVYERHR
ncbi:MAG: hypothetical protein ACYCXU_01160 [Thermoleophilia bacterium]